MPSVLRAESHPLPRDDQGERARRDADRPSLFYVGFGGLILFKTILHLLDFERLGYEGTRPEAQVIARGLNAVLAQRFGADVARLDGLADFGIRQQAHGSESMGDLDCRSSGFW